MPRDVHSRMRTWFFVVCALLLGFIGGVLVQRQREPLPSYPQGNVGGHDSSLVEKRDAEIADLMRDVGRLESELAARSRSLDEMREENSLLKQKLEEADGRVETALYPSGEKQEEGVLRGGTREGIWQGWHLNGKPAWRCEYYKGKRWGKWEKWSPEGILLESGTYANDLKEGDWVYWNEQNRQRSVVRYVGGATSP
jgi:hypothetical protein